MMENDGTWAAGVEGVDIPSPVEGRSMDGRTGSREQRKVNVERGIA